MGCLGDEKIHLLVAGRLAPLARRLALRHLRTCEECSTRLAAARRLLLQGIVPLAAAHGLAHPDPETLRARIRQAVLADRRHRRPAGGLAAIPRYAMLAATAVVLVAVLGYWFLGETRWKVRLLQTGGAVYVAPGGEDPLPPGDRPVDLAAGSMILVLPGGRAVAAVEGVGAFEFTGNVVAVVGGDDGPPIHLRHGIVRVTAQPGSAPSLVAGPAHLTVQGEAEVMVLDDAPADRLAEARRLAEDLAARGLPALVPDARAEELTVVKARVHALRGEVLLHDGRPPVPEGCAVTISSVPSAPATLRPGPILLYSERDLSPLEIEAIPGLLAYHASPLPALRMAAADPALDPSRRALAAWLTGTVGDVQGVPGLARILLDPASPSVLRGAAVRSLALLGDRDSVAAALRHRDSAAVEAAVRALAPGARPGEARAIAAVAADGERPDGLRALAAAAGGSPEAIPTALLAELATSSDPDAAALAEFALGRRNDAESLATLRTLLAEGPPERRACAARALSARRDPEAVPALLAAAAPGQPEPLRSAAIYALLGVGRDDPDFSRVLEQALSGEDGPAFRAALFALPTLPPNGPETSPDPLVQRYVRPLFDRTDVSEETLTLALSRHSPSDAELRRFLDTAQRPGLRANALRALARRRSSLLPVADVLLLLRAGDSYLRYAAAEALAELDPSAAFTALVETTDARGSLPLTDVLGIIALAASTPAGREAIATRAIPWLAGLARGDGEPLVRALALQMLARIGGGSPALVRDVTLEILAVPGNPVRVRAEALRALSRLPVDGDSLPEAVRTLLARTREPELSHLVFPLVELPASSLLRALPEVYAAAIRSPDPALRARAVLLVTDGFGSDADLRERAGDANAVVRLAAFSGLLRRGADTDPGSERRALEELSSLEHVTVSAGWASLPAPDRADKYRALVLSVASAPGATAPGGPYAGHLADLRVLAAEDRQFLSASALRRLDGPLAPVERAEALSDLAWSGARAGLDILFAAADDGDETVRAAALKATKQLIGGTTIPLFADMTLDDLRAWWDVRAYSWAPPFLPGGTE